MYPNMPLFYVHKHLIKNDGKTMDAIIKVLIVG
jgi:hypothetical protein